MATKTTKSKSKSTTKQKEALISPTAPTSVSIEKADNGFTVSVWGDEGRKTLIAKSEAEAFRHVKTLLAGKKGK